jgi:hypothetical protein
MLPGYVIVSLKTFQNEKRHSPAWPSTSAAANKRAAAMTITLRDMANRLAVKLMKISED